MQSTSHLFTKGCNETNDKTKSSISNMTHGKTTKTHTTITEQFNDRYEKFVKLTKKDPQETEGSDISDQKNSILVLVESTKGVSSNTSFQKTHSKSTKRHCKCLS